VKRALDEVVRGFLHKRLVLLLTGVNYFDDKTLYAGLVPARGQEGLLETLSSISHIELAET